MIYVDQDFYSNFSSAVKANDSDQQRDMLLGEIATLIVKNRDEVIELLKAVAVILPRVPSDKVLVNACVKQFGNPKFQSGIAFLIAKRSELLDAAKKNGSVDPIAAIANGIDGSGHVNGSDAKTTEDKNRTDLMLKVLELKGEKPKNNTGMYILIGVLGLAAVVTTVVLLKKKK